MGNEQLLLQVWAASAEFKLNDVIIMRLAGITSDGEAIDIEVRQSIDKSPPTVVEVMMDNAGARALAKTQGRFSFELERDGSVIQRSKGRFINFIGEPQRLLAPSAEDEQNGAIDPDLPSTHIRIPFDNSMLAGMAIELIWFGIRSDLSSYNPELLWYFLSDEDIKDKQDLFIIVDGVHLKILEGGTLKLSYNLLSEGENGEIISRSSLPAAPLNVGEPKFELVKPSVLGEQNGKLDLNNLPNGVSQLTAPRPTVNPTKANDVVTYTWIGEVTGKKENSITLNSLSKDKDVRFALNAQFVDEHIKPNQGKKVTASYRIWRAETNTTSYSNRLEFVIGEASDEGETPIGSGTLKVMGARSNRSTYRAYSAFSKLSAFDATTGKPLPAQWKYDNDASWSTASSTWIDEHPHKPLQVRTSNDQATLNPANIIGNGIDTTVTGQAAFMAHRDERGVAGWGNAAHGSNIPPTIITMKDIKTVRCTSSAYAALRDNRSVVVWGNAAEGGSMPGVNPLNFVAIIGNATAFAGIKNDGTVVAWGTAANGGTVPAAISALTDIVQLFAAGQAFVAQQATGFIVAWGQPGNGGTIPPEIAVLDDIQTIIGNLAAFAAFRPNGTVVAWGHASYGATVPAEIAALTNIERLVCASEQAFAAILTTGEVIAWGGATHGGTVDPLIKTLNDIVGVSATRSAFAARRGNGHVVAWGNQAEGGLVPAAIAILDNIVQVCGSSMAFAALCQDGTVVVWGNATVGGDISAVASLLVNVVAIYANTHGFTALTSDGRVVTWGQAAGGGDSSAVQGQLTGKVSYLATAAP
ncbi:hypothetical protein HCU66_26380 [Pseudomonas frederiksbergensis]|uniref:RCC1 domain-containing protein n=1 Tax=Pseudomonas frederiksbergensis TaxID=104087 RepID=UPI00197CE132|nr:hypothetical protein [Pseudomonas frederiksbergensis]MBN3865722.1 hypothetical protein [Pseudomonas frederiksbergensis]